MKIRNLIGKIKIMKWQFWNRNKGNKSEKSEEKWEINIQRNNEKKRNKTWCVNEAKDGKKTQILGLKREVAFNNTKNRNSEK